MNTALRSRLGAFALAAGILAAPALERSGFSSSGSLYVDNFKIEGKQLSGRFYTKKKEEFFDDSWEVDLNVKAAVP